MRRVEPSNGLLGSDFEPIELSRKGFPGPASEPLFEPGQRLVEAVEEVLLRLRGPLTKGVFDLPVGPNGGQRRSVDALVVDGSRTGIRAYLSDPLRPLVREALPGELGVGEPEKRIVRADVLGDGPFLVRAENSDVELLRLPREEALPEELGKSGGVPRFGKSLSRENRGSLVVGMAVAQRSAEARDENFGTKPANRPDEVLDDRSSVAIVEAPFVKSFG